MSNSPRLAPCRLCDRFGNLLCFAAAAAILVLGVVLRYREILSLWWAQDDLHHVLFVLAHSPVDYFFDPGVYRLFDVAYFTPWYLLTYDVLLSAFGLDPFALYVYHLLFLGAAALVTFGFLRFWVDTIRAGLGTALFVFSGSTAAVATQLMNTHYLQGYVFWGTAAMLFVLAARTDSRILALMSAGASLLAMSSKEIFVPMACLLFVLPVADHARRRRAILPSLGAILLYLSWRWFMLGSLVHAPGLEAILRSLPPFLGRLPGGLVTPGSAGTAGLILLALGGIALIFRNPPLGRIPLVAVLCLMAPLATIFHRITGPERTLILWAWALACGVTLVCHHLARSPRRHDAGLSVLILALIGFAVLQLSATVQEEKVSRARDFSAVGRCVMEKGRDVVLYFPGEAYEARLAVRYKEIRGLSDLPRVVSHPDDFSPADRSRQLFVYDRERQELVPSSRSVEELIVDAARRKRPAPLEVELWNADSGTHWRFGPYRDRRYTVYIPDGDIYMAEAPAEGFVAGGARPMQFLVRYRSAEGWETRSPLLTWDNRRNEHLVWSRPMPASR